MPKLQRIDRANGSQAFSVNIPLDIIEELGWKKGDILEIEVYPDKSGKLAIIVFNDKINEQEEKNNETVI